MPISEFSSFPNVHIDRAVNWNSMISLWKSIFSDKVLKWFGGLLFLVDARSGTSGGFGIGVAAEGTVPGFAGCSGVLDFWLFRYWSFYTHWFRCCSDGFLFFFLIVVRLWFWVVQFDMGGVSAADVSAAVLHTWTLFKHEFWIARKANISV